VLPPSEQASAVAHLRVPGHRADIALPKRLYESAQRLRLEDRVGVDHGDDVVASRRDPGVQRGGFTPIGLADDLNAVQREPLDELGGPVCGAVVDDDDLELRIVARRE
jgi:hypothetical protein